MMGQTLKRLRKEKGITQQQLSEKLNVTQVAVSEWESGKRRPDIDMLPAIAELFEVSINEIYGKEPHKDNALSEAWAIRERLRRDPSYRMLFSAADNATPEHLRAAAAMLKALEPKEPDE